MTVSTEVLSNQYAGNGSTDDFDYDFMIYDDDELVVRLIDSDGNATLQTEGVHYTVTGAGVSTGGTVTFTEAPANGVTVDLRPVYNLLQSASIRNQGRFLPEIHESVFDRLTRFQQFLYRLAQQSLRLPDHGTLQSGELLDLDQRKGTYLYFDEVTGEPTHATNIGTTPLTQPIFDGFLEDTQQTILAPILNPRSPAELTALVTPSNYNYLSAEALGGMFRYGAVGNYTGPGVGTDDSSAFRRMAAVIQARGGGIIDLGSRRYRVFSDGSTDPIVELSNLRGVTIKSDGAEIVIDRTFTGSQIIQVMQFTDVVGAKLVGNLKFTCTQTQAAVERADRGPEAMVFFDSCSQIDLDGVEAASCRLAVEFRRNSMTVTNRARRIRIGKIKATSTGYGLACVLSGDELEAYIETDGAVRSYYPYGMVDHKVRVRSKNFKGNADCNLATAGGLGAQGIDLDYINDESTDADNSVRCIVISYSDQTAASHIGHRIKARVITGATAYTGFVVAIEKLDNSENPDTTDRGHILRDIEIQAYVDGDNANQRTIATVGTWGAGETVRDITFKNLVLEASGQPQFNFLRSIVGGALFERCNFTVTPDLPVPVGAGYYVFDSSRAPNFTTSTADTSTAHYRSCRLTDGTNQSVINKHFWGTTDGSVTLTYTGGFTATVQGTMRYSINGNVVTVSFDSASGTSNSTQLLVAAGGLPALIRPTANRLTFARHTDNGTTGVSTVRFGTDGALTWFNAASSSTFFTNSGTKGNPGFDISYTL